MVIDDVVVIHRLRQILLVEIVPTNQLTSSEGELLALLQRLIAVAADKAPDVVHEVVLNAHHKLVRADLLATASAFRAINPAKLKL